MFYYNARLKKLSQILRRNMTEAERLLWSRLRMKQLKGFQVYRQKIIGNYIIDFYCPKARLIIEIDGGQHYSEAGIGDDGTRDAYLKGLGFKVLRFSNMDVLQNIKGVVEEVYKNL